MGLSKNVKEIFKINRSSFKNSTNKEKKILANNLFSGFSLCLSSIRPIKKNEIVNSDIEKICLWGRSILKLSLKKK